MEQNQNIKKEEKKKIMDSEKNPCNICIWADNKICEDCSINKKLQCHLDLKYSAMFGGTFFIFFIPAIIGIFKLGVESLLFYLGLVSWIVYLVIFFLIWEPQMLCSHCPYYAEGGTKILHCYANGGFIRTASFKPHPMNKSEQIQFIFGVLLIGVIPYVFLIIGQQFLLLGISALGFVIWLIVLKTQICTVCINFSCPFNSVPKDIVDEFLKKNPIMRDAWEKSGYKIE
ncbi:hypothetical protein DSAG12_01403 [Promethearchaeum syntrophicum]|uniref:Uncharacterized protein n=1 Tax=Promethearchaeum syntrophicum TaxID=2594042 RepID=A0A5B9D9R5_9ARCH|nr:hypothetical protein [Candidatus Prometheoarchaeum syntrophicum]